MIIATKCPRHGLGALVRIVYDDGKGQKLLRQTLATGPNPILNVIYRPCSGMRFHRARDHATAGSRHDDCSSDDAERRKSSTMGLAGDAVQAQNEALRQSR